jgi:hypothetical protein
VLHARLLRVPLRLQLLLAHNAFEVQAAPALVPPTHTPWQTPPEHSSFALQSESTTQTDPARTPPPVFDTHRPPKAQLPAPPMVSTI